MLRRFRDAGTKEDFIIKYYFKNKLRALERGTREHEMAEEPPKEDFSVGPLSLLAESVKKNCQVEDHILHEFKFLCELYQDEFRTMGEMLVPIQIILIFLN
jgi:hypothetical protein